MIRFTLAAILVAATAAMAQDRSRDEAEVRLAVPRNPDGTINLRALNAEIDRGFAAGATEVHFRLDRLTQDELRRLLLVSDRNLLIDIGARLPKDGVERQVRFRGEVEARVQRTEEGELRARIEQINLGNMSASERAALAREIAESGNLDRVRIRGTDGTRVEFRDDRGIVRNEGRGDRREARDDRVARADNSGPGRGGRVERERPERLERHQRVERAERAERAERPERAERSGGGNSGRR